MSAAIAMAAIEAEQSLVGCALHDAGSVLRRCSGRIEAASFAVESHRMVWSAITERAANGMRADRYAVSEFLAERNELDRVGGMAYLSALESMVPSASHAHRWAELVEAAAAGRALKEAARAVADAAASEAGIEARWSAVDTAMAEARRWTRMGTKTPTMREAVADVITRMEQRAAGERADTVPTGVHSLDAILGGGLSPGRVMVLAGRPGTGKSTFAREIVISAAKRGPVLLASLEMLRAEVSDALMVRCSSVTSDRFVSADKLTSDDYTRITEGAEELASLPITIIDDSSLSAERLAAHAYGIQGLKLIAVDYLQLMTPPAGLPKGATTNDRVAAISRAIKRLAMEAGVPVVLLSQLSRDVERRGGEPGMQDLRDSGAIEQDADICTMLWTAQEFEHHRLIGVRVAKHRGGPTGRFALRFTPDVYRFWPSDEDLSPQRYANTSRRRGVTE